MNNAQKESLWKQFGGSIDMLENALQLCPDTLWNNGTNFWHYAFHCLFYLDYYLTLDPNEFAPPAPFTLSEFDASGALPPRVYTQAELLTYLQYCRSKCHQLLANMTEDVTAKRWVNPYRDYAVFELLLYNMRHVQHHTAQLNLLLRQGINEAPNWVSHTKVPL